MIFEIIVIVVTGAVDVRPTSGRGKVVSEFLQILGQDGTGRAVEE